MQQPPLPPAMGSAPSFDAKETGDRKGLIGQHRGGYLDEQGPRVHVKETTSKINRRETDQYPLSDKFFFNVSFYALSSLVCFFIAFNVIVMQLHFLFSAHSIFDDGTPSFSEL